MLWEIWYTLGADLVYVRGTSCTLLETWCTLRADLVSEASVQLNNCCDLLTIVFTH